MYSMLCIKQDLYCNYDFGKFLKMSNFLRNANVT